MTVQDDAPQQPTADQPAPEPGPAQFHLRRAPKYGAFGATGLVIGVVIGLVLAFSHPAEGDYTERTIAGYFAASFGLIGVLLGLALAVWADRRARVKFQEKRTPRT